MFEKAVLTDAAKARPAGVRTTLRCARKKSGLLSSLSRALIFWLTAACVTPNSLAAIVKLPSRAALSNVDKRFIEETLRRSRVTAGTSMQLD
jgi:hypothetical protein